MRTMKRVVFVFFLLFASTLLFSQTRTELQVNELQKPIVEYIEKNFKGFSIEYAFKVDDKGVITFDICISKDKTNEKLFFDKEGRFLRHEPCLLECCQGAKKK
jgi:hypothetical protein